MKKKVLKMCAPLVKLDPNPYWKLLMVSTILGGVYFYSLLWKIGYRPIGHYTQISPLELCTVIFVQTTTIALALSVMANICLFLVSSLVMNQLFKLEWRRMTGHKWINDDPNSWDYHDNILAQLAWDVKNVEHQPDTAEPLIRRFWCTQIIAGALEDEHPYTGKTRKKLGDISYYHKLYKHRHPNLR